MRRGSRGHNAVVTPAGSYDGHVQSDCDGHRTGTTGNGRPISDLVDVVVAPAIRRAIRGDAARVEMAGAERAEGEPPDHRQRRQLLYGGSFAKLTNGIVAPPVRRADRRHATRVQAATVDRAER